MKIEDTIETENYNIDTITLKKFAKKLIWILLQVYMRVCVCVYLCMCVLYKYVIQK